MGFLNGRAGIGVGILGEAPIILATTSQAGVLINPYDHPTDPIPGQEWGGNKI